MNGKPLPADSADMRAMVAYFDWMKKETKPQDKVAGRGVGKMGMAIKPDVENGKQVYAAQCAVCHGKDGEGLKQADGRVVTRRYGAMTRSISAPAWRAPIPRRPSSSATCRSDSTRNSRSGKAGCRTRTRLMSRSISRTSRARIPAK